MDIVIYIIVENKLDLNMVSFVVDSDIFSNLNKSIQLIVDVYF